MINNKGIEQMMNSKIIKKNKMKFKQKKMIVVFKLNLIL